MSLVVLPRVWIPALLVVPASLVLSVLLLQQDMELWRADAGWAWVNWSTQALVLAPLLGAAAAWSTVESLALGRGEWVASTVRGAAYAVLPLAVGILTGLAVLLLTAAVVAMLRTGGTGGVAWFLPALATALSSIVTCVSLGVIAGRIWPNPIVAGIVLALEWASSAGLGDIAGIGGLLGLDGASIPLVGYEFRMDLLVNRVIVALLSAGLAAMVVMPRRWTVRSALQRTSAILPALALPIALYGPGLLVDTPDVQSDPSASASECSRADEGEVRVCVLPGGAKFLPDLVQGFSKLDDARSGLGLPRVKEFKQRTPGEHFRRLDGRVVLAPREREGTFEIPTGGDVVLPAAVSLVMQPECSDGREQHEPDHWTEVIVILGWWTATSIDGSARSNEYAVPGDPIVARFNELSPRARADYLRAALSATGTCDLSGVPLLRAS